MFNEVVVNLVYEYMLQESELDELVEKFNNIKPKRFKNLFKDLIAEENQDKKIDSFVRGYFEEIIRKRPAIGEPTAENIVDLLQQFDEEDQEQES